MSESSNCLHTSEYSNICILKECLKKVFIPSFEPWLHPCHVHIEHHRGNMKGMVKS